MPASADAPANASALLQLLKEGKIVPIEKYSHPLKVPEEARVIDLREEGNRKIVTLQFLQSDRTVRIDSLDNVAPIQAGQTLQRNQVIGTEPKVVLYSISDGVNSSIPSVVRPQ